VNPFKADTVDEVFRRIRTSPAPDARTLRPACPPGVAGFFADALALDRSRRPQTAEELRNQLQWLRRSLKRDRVHDRPVVR
jgi:hypothetical protein